MNRSTSRSPSPNRQESSTSQTFGYKSRPTLSPLHNPQSTPQFIYGTAWKKERTAGLVYNAIKSGFRAIDTANQPKHYHETGVGEGVQLALKDKLISSREELYLQTKFTSISGQDPNNMPYHQSQPLQDQVHTSVKKSLQHLQTDYIDCLVLHGPLGNYKDTLTVWRAMEEHVDNGNVIALGVSNIYSLPYLSQLYNEARYKPMVVQNRFYEETGHDKDIRQFCLDNHVKYQSFWTLTANPHITRSRVVQTIAQRKNISPECVLYRWMMSQGCQVLNGTTSAQHMQEDLASLHVDLEPSEVDSIKQLF